MGLSGLRVMTELPQLYHLHPRLRKRDESTCPLNLSPKTVWELAINRGSLFPLFLCGKREGAWNLICLNKCVICKKFSHFNSISCLVFNTMFIIKYAPEFIYFCQAVGQLHLAMQTLFYV